MNLPQGFVYLKDIDPTIKQDIRYGSDNNFLGRVVKGYLAPLAIITEIAAIGLKKAQNSFNKLGYDIIVYDAYRPQQAVDDFWRWANDTNDIVMKDIYYPDYNDKTKLFLDGFIARYSKHSRGSAVDISLINTKTLKAIDMGSIFDFFGPITYTNTYLISNQAQENRLLLKEIMESHGFRSYHKEWWHFEFINEPFTRNPEDHFNFQVK